MFLLFVTNQRVGARLIRWVTGGKCSHVAVYLDELDLVVHSTMTAGGINLDWYEKFLEHNTVIASVRVASTPELLRKLREATGTGYDYILLLTMGLRKLGLPIPQVDNPYRDLCTEVVTEYVLDEPGSKYTPDELLAHLQSPE
jgi:hypothetical protein